MIRQPTSRPELSSRESFSGRRHVGPNRLGLSPTCRRRLSGPAATRRQAVAGDTPSCRRFAAARPGFTMVELMVTVTIIGILAGLAYGTLQMARETAKVAQTKTTVSKLHQIIIARYESYRTRRVPLSRSQIDLIITTNSWPENSRSVARVRLNGLRDLMRMEMPDRWSDVTTYDQANDVADPSVVCLVPGMTRPALSYRYMRGFWQAYSRLVSQGLSSEQALNRVEVWGAAELLYMIVMNSPEAADQFNPNEIGDYDNDGLREFHDGWGLPIRFLRWPAGFVPANAFFPPNQADWEYPADTELQTGNPTADPDPFDPLGVGGGYALYPLIYSAGPDGIFDINIGKKEVSGQEVTQEYQLTSDGELSPYVEDGLGHLIGRPLDAKTPAGEPNNEQPDHFDNIHNHRLEAR